jgi:hypothetical protein
MYADAGKIDLNKTLEALGIHKMKPGLSDQEKKATIAHLLSARSGVYLPAAFEPPKDTKPARGSHPPGTFWCYNNWDNNVLCTILEKELGLKFFETLQARIARPLGMQDFRVRDGCYYYESDKSPHPAYPIRMSARDLARFGLLYLKEGVWQDRRLVSEDWIKKSTRPISKNTPWGGFGYLWWIPDQEPFSSLGMYSSIGLGEQSIDVVPGADMVFVHRTNTFTMDRITHEERHRLLQMILEARTGKPVEDPELVPLPAVTRSWKPYPLTDEQKQAFCGELLNASGDPCHVYMEEGELLYKTPLGDVALIPLCTNRFLLDDFYEEICVEKSEDGRHRKMFTEMDLNRAGYEHLLAGDIDNAIQIFKKAVHYYPCSFNVYDSLGEAYMVARQWELARKNYKKSIEINPKNTNGMEMLHKIDVMEQKEP